MGPGMSHCSPIPCSLPGTTVPAPAREPPAVARFAQRYNVRILVTHDGDDGAGADAGGGGGWGSLRI